MVSRVPVVLFLFLLGFPCVSAQDRFDKNLSIAESQHEIIRLLIENKQYGKVLENARKIFALKFPTSQQHLLVEEARILTAMLVRDQQYGLAHSILDEAIKAVGLDQLKGALYKEKAYVCVKEGREEAAMELFQRAIELEQSGP